MMALLIGKEPGICLGCSYVAEGSHDMVVIGSLNFSQLLCFREEAVFLALAEGKPVLLYEPGLPPAPRNRTLAASLASAKRELKNWGVQFTDGRGKRLITAQEARDLRSQGKKPPFGAVLTPMAREILEGIE